MNTALSAALLHFLWQGAGIAFALAVAFLFLKSAKTRYAWACIAMLAMPLVFTATFVWSLPPEPTALRVPLFFTRVQPTGSAVMGTSHEPVRIDPNSLWMIGVGLLYGYRMLGWIAAQRLRRRGVCAAPSEWQSRAVELGARIRLTRPVALLESALAETPVTIGVWRPVILMPLGLLAGLPGAQVEAILLHELAHIRRHDYLVNLLQAVVEGLLFYHPATWWVSRAIRREREMCCDDVAVAAAGDALTYTRALAALEQHRVRVPILAVTGGPLMSRIQRLLGQPSKYSAVPALVFLALATGAALFAFEPAPAPLPIPTPIPEPAPSPAPAPVPKPQPPASPAPQQEAAGPILAPQIRLADLGLSPSVEEPYNQWLNQEVLWIVTPEERSAFGRLVTDDERSMFIEQFWLRRDPTPDTQANELREEHYRRIAWANARFASGIPGWKTDRGMVYIKFGPADEREEHPNGGRIVRPPEEGGGEIDAYPFEKWRYRYLEGVGSDVVIEFVDKTGTGEYRMTWDPNDKDQLLRVPRAGLTLYEQLDLAEKRARAVAAPAAQISPNMFDRLQRFVTILPRPTK